MDSTGDFESFYQTLDHEQRAAADHIGSHSVLFAGPGTGKTRTIKGKVLALVKRHEVPPQQILALAFTRIAANQLRDEICQVLGINGNDGLEPLGEEVQKKTPTPHVSTIHAFALRQIIKNGDRVESLPKPVRVADDFFEREVVIQDLKGLLGIPVKQVTQELHELSASWERNETESEREHLFVQRNAQFLAHWREHRRVFGYTLRDEMVYQVKQALEQNPSFQLESNYLHLVVDEYQDLNPCDLALIRAMAARGCEITAAGDDDQSIYGFRHASPQAIRGFTQTYAGGQEFTLSVCHRCPQSVLDLAHFVIRQDTARKDKGTKPKPGCLDGKIELHAFRDQSQEARGLAQMIGRHRSPDGSFDKVILVLLRGDKDEKYSKVIVEALAEAGIAVAPDSVVRPLETPSGVLLRALLSLTVDATNSMAWRVLLQTQKNNRVGEKALRDVYDLCVANRWEFYQGLRGIVANPGLVKAGSAVAKAVGAVDAHLSETTKDIPAMDVVIERAIQVMVPEAERSAIADDIQQEIFSLGIDSIEGLLTSVAVRSVEDEGTGLDPGVHVMTMHKSKGLSAPVVFVACAENHVLPGLDRTKEEELEMRRLFFVAVTRSKEELVFTWAMERNGNQMNHETRKPRRPDQTPFLKDSGLKCEIHWR